MNDSLWMVKLVNHPLYDEKGRALLFSGEDEAITAGIAEWGEACEPYIYAEECRLAEHPQ